MPIAKSDNKGIPALQRSAMSIEIQYISLRTPDEV